MTEGCLGKGLTSADVEQTALLLLPGLQDLLSQALSVNTAVSQQAWQNADALMQALRIDALDSYCEWDMYQLACAMIAFADDAQAAISR